jgi:4a-hydroxytetrahydrobiopterin dehydratase
MCPDGTTHLLADHDESRESGHSAATAAIAVQGRCETRRVTDAPLSRPEASAAVAGTGWRLLYGSYLSSVAVDGLRHAIELAGLALDACGAAADDHLRADVRHDLVAFTLQTRGTTGVTALDAVLAARINDAMRAGGFELTAAGPARPEQIVEFAIDALDIPKIRPFWKAVMGYVDEPDPGPAGGLRDPAGRGPSIWFQQMDAPRPQRNRIHFDLDVAHDEADRRVAAALAAGGTLVSDAEARAFWVLADAEGNEICVCTWQDRD